MDKRSYVLPDWASLLSRDSFTFVKVLLLTEMLYSNIFNEYSLQQFYLSVPCMYWALWRFNVEKGDNGLNSWWKIKYLQSPKNRNPHLVLQLFLHGSTHSVLHGANKTLKNFLDIITLSTLAAQQEQLSLKSPKSIDFAKSFTLQILHSFQHFPTSDTKLMGL